MWQTDGPCNDTLRHVILQMAVPYPLPNEEDSIGMETTWGFALGSHRRVLSSRCRLRRTRHVRDMRRGLGMFHYRGVAFLTTQLPSEALSSF